MEKAAFKLDTYKFKKASIDFNIPNNAELNISFNPKGVFYQKENRYELSFDTIITCKETGTPVINISCVAYFSFRGTVSLNEIPDFFYPNSIAILFPYIRAFVSTISLQANTRPILLPTINLIGLTDKLRSNTVAK